MKFKNIFRILAIFMLTSAYTCGQEVGKPIVVSPLIGDALDVWERNFYHLFPSFDGFDYAVFYLNPDSTLKVKVSLFQNGIEKDTIIERYHALSLTRNYLEECGKFNGERLPMYIEKPWKIAGVRTTGGAYVHDLFPFSDYDIEMDLYPNWNFGVGLSSYTPDFSGLAAAFDSIENKYRKRGTTIRHHELDFSASPLLWFTIKIRFSRPLALLLETGTSIARGKNAVLAPLSASILYYFDPLNMGGFHSYVGAGIGHYRFMVEEVYGDPISSGYLASIRSEGGKIGYSLTGGIEINLLKRLCLTIYGKYLLIPVLETNSSEGAAVNVELSSFLVGTQLSIPF